ncbi:hypothetical protein [Undibacterium curvum]|uniref:hypothetical protein n=1 Tax=Undibacterium curvum TaxID=2762294 RepID=UPI003D0C8755
MNRWLDLNTKNRVQFIIFVALGCFFIAAPLMMQQPASTVLRQLPIGFAITALAANPANYENGAVLSWSAQPIHCKILLVLAAVCFLTSIPLKWFV